MRRGRNVGEGWLIAAALALAFALALGIWWRRQPRTESVAPLHCVDAAAVAAASRVNVNAAPARKLQELPGIGPVLAEAIVTYREEHGPFESIDALDDVPGIGPAKIEAMRPYIRLE